MRSRCHGIRQARRGAPRTRCRARCRRTTRRAAAEGHVGPVVHLAAGDLHRRAEAEVEVPVEERHRRDEPALGPVVEREAIGDHARRQHRRQPRDRPGTSPWRTRPAPSPRGTTGVGPLRPAERHPQHRGSAPGISGTRWDRRGRATATRARRRRSPIRRVTSGRRRRRPVVEDPQALVTGDEVRTIERLGDAEGLAELGRAAAQVPVAGRRRPGWPAGVRGPPSAPPPAAARRTTPHHRTRRWRTSASRGEAARRCPARPNIVRVRGVSPR